MVEADVVEDADPDRAVHDIMEQERANKNMNIPSILEFVNMESSYIWGRSHNSPHIHFIHASPFMRHHHIIYAMVHA